MADNKVFPKQQLEIVQVQDPKAYAGGAKFLLPVVAKNLSLAEGDPGRGKSWKYTVFNQDLQDHIKPLAVGARFLCDIEERDRPDSEYGPDRNIVQIYVDGKPVSTKKGAGGYRGRTLEEDIILENVKRRSIEGQTAIAQVGTVLTCPTPIPGEDLGLDEEGWKRILDKYWQAVEKSLDNFLTEPTSGPASEPDQRAQDKQGKAQASEKVPKDATPSSDPIKDVGDLLTRAHKIGLSQRDIFSIAEVGNVEELKGQDLQALWAKVRKKGVTQPAAA